MNRKEIVDELQRFGMEIGNSKKFQEKPNENMQEILRESDVLYENRVSNLFIIRIGKN